MPEEQTLPPRGEDKAHSRRCESFVEHAFDVIAIVGPTGTVKYTSPSTYAVLGYRPQETIGWNSDDLVHPADRAMVVKNRAYLVRHGGRSTPAELRLRHQDGRYRIVEMVAQNLLDDPDIAGILVNYRDVTEFRRTEERYKKSFKSNPDSVTISYRETGRFLAVNDGFEEHSGYTWEEVKDRSAFDLQFWKDRTDRDRVLDMLEEHGSVRNFEAKFVVRSGEVKTGLVSAEAIELEEAPCVLMVIRDITTVVLVTEQLREAGDALSEQHNELVRKNIALGEVLKHLEHEKAVFRHEVSTSLENLLSPLIDKLEDGGERLRPDEIDRIRVALHRVLGEEIDDYRSNITKLTPRELDIVGLIKEGLTTKEIAERLGLSTDTVQKHRQSIRKKLQIDRRGLSLASYLRTHS